MLTKQTMVDKGWEIVRSEALDNGEVLHLRKQSCIDTFMWLGNDGNHRFFPSFEDGMREITRDSQVNG
jgi:hypothetical protein